MNNVTNVTVDTKPSKDATATQTKLTINWDGMSPEDIRALAQQSLVIKWQGKHRITKKNPEPLIPAEASVNATDYKVGSRVAKVVTIEDVKALFAKMTPEQKAAFLAANS